MFIENLLNLLKLKGIKQVELCKKIDIPKTSINNWKKGSMPSIETANKIAKELDVTLDYVSKRRRKRKQIRKIIQHGNKRRAKNNRYNAREVRKSGNIIKLQDWVRGNK